MTYRNLGNGGNKECNPDMKPDKDSAIQKLILSWKNEVIWVMIKLSPFQPQHFQPEKLWEWCGTDTKIGQLKYKE